MQGRPAIEDIDVMVGLEAFTHQNVKADLRTGMHLAHGLLRLIGQQRHIDRVMRHQLGEKGATLQPAQALGLGVIHVEEVAPHRVPERRVAGLVAVANDLHHQRIGKALRMVGQKQQTPPRVQLGPGGVHQRPLDVKAGQQAIAGEVVAQREHVDLVMDLQLAGVVYEGLVTKAVERLGIAGRSNDAGAANQATALAVFEDEEVALFTVKADLGGKRGLRGGDLFAQTIAVVRQ